MADTDTRETRESREDAREGRSGAAGRDSSERAGENTRNGQSGQGGAKGLFKGDKKQLVIMLAAVLGVIIAWITYRRMTGGSSTPAAGTLGGQTLGGLTPDPSSTGTDPYAGLEARLDRQNQLLNTLNNRLRHPTQPPPHRPPRGHPGNEKAHFIYGPAARGLRYIKNLATGAIYQVNPNGKRYRLTRAQYAELGDPKYTTYRARPPHKDNHPPSRHPKPPDHHRKRPPGEPKPLARRGVGDPATLRKP